MQIRLDDRVAVITGGSKGLGLAMGHAFAGAGATVALLARDMEGLRAAQADVTASSGGEGAGRVHVYSCDVSRAEAVRTTFDALVRDLGRVDVLVNNAGTSRTGAFESITDEVWQDDLDLKLFAAIRLSRLAWPGMKARNFGRIINVLNTHAKAPRAGSSPTSVSRAAGMALTKVMAGEGAAHGILVNALLVGVIVSDQWVRRHAASAPDTPFDAFTRELARDVPLGRMGRPEEFANLALFLASDAGSYVTGTAINVDGGRAPVV